MCKIRVNDGICTIRQKSDYGGLIWTVGGSEGAWALKHGKTEIVLELYNCLRHIAV